MLNEQAIAELEKTKICRRIEHMCSLFGKRGTLFEECLDCPEECKRILLEIYLREEEKEIISNLPKEDFDFVMSEIKYFINLWNTQLKEIEKTLLTKENQRKILESFLEEVK